MRALAVLVLTEGAVGKPRQQSLDVAFSRRQDADGCPVCVVCGERLLKMDGSPRHVSAKYCSESCTEHAYVVCGDTGTIRRLLTERDKEICASCGLECGDLGDAAKRFFWSAPGDVRPSPRGRGEAADRFERLCHELGKAVRRRLDRLGFGRFTSHYWEADHVVPVSEGGGGCGIEGYQTLCVPCHKKESARLVGRLATARSRQGSLPF